MKKNEENLRLWEDYCNNASKRWSLEPNWIYLNPQHYYKLKRLFKSFMLGAMMIEKYEKPIGLSLHIFLFWENERCIHSLLLCWFYLSEHGIGVDVRVLEYIYWKMVFHKKKIYSDLELLKKLASHHFKVFDHD